MIWLAIGLGCLWHGGQIVWVAPTPRLLQRRLPHSPSQHGPLQQEKKAQAVVSEDSAVAFQLFWLDQYAWIGITLVILGLLFCGLGLS